MKSPSWQIASPFSVLTVTVLVIAALTPRAQAQTDDAPPGALPPAFHEAVDMSHLARIAVHAQGRVRSFESHASQMMHMAVGPPRVDGRSHAFTYLDVMIRPGAYADADVVYVRNKNVRARIVRALDRVLNDRLQQMGGEAERQAFRSQFEDRMERFMSTGRLSPVLLETAPVRALLREMRSDIIRTKKDVDRIDTALSVLNPQTLARELRIVPPPGGGYEDPWLTVDQFAGADTRIERAGLDSTLQQDIVDTWERFWLAWRDQDATTVNETSARLAGLLPQVNPSLYPSVTRLDWESWYFRAYNMTWVWMIYLMAIVFLLMSIIYRWRAASWIGLGTFLIAFGLHTFAVLLRWYVSERFPNSNMFEAVTTSVWFGGWGALLLEAWVRKTGMRNLFLLASSGASMVAMMSAYYLPVYLDPNISNMMPVLHDLWLYIHTNVIIFSYVLIFMAAMSSLVYLGYRLFGGQADFAKAGGAAMVMSGDAEGLADPDGSAAMTPTGPPKRRVSLGEIFDGATMVLMELSFVLLWAGLVMGAIWADHSWGRPWGWDPKEVFALNTFIVFVVLVHVRLKVRDKGLWTALLALFGAGVMLFNWIVINFYISGLHSYA